jgi:hypothetical protein
MGAGQGNRVLIIAYDKTYCVLGAVIILLNQQHQ